MNPRSPQAPADGSKGTDLTSFQLKAVSCADKINLGSPFTLSAKAMIPVLVTLSGSSSSAELQLVTADGLVGGTTPLLLDQK